VSAASTTVKIEYITVVIVEAIPVRDFFGRTKARGGDHMDN
jgi:hypothetical protein